MQAQTKFFSAFDIGISRQNLLYWFSHSLFLFLAIYLFWPPLSWITHQFTGESHRFQMFGITMLAGAMIYRRVSSDKAFPGLKLKPTYAPLFVFVAGCAGYLVNEHFLGIHVFSAAFCIVAIYGIWGFYNDKTVWQESMIPAALAILLLPFANYLDVYFGFPLRLFTAHAANDFLSAMGFASLSTDTLIVLDNRFANVELSCSGIKGLWAGLLFFVLLTWVERKAITLSWWWRFGCFCGMLIAMNVFRVAIIVMLGLGLQQVKFADLLHQGLGVLGFAFACLAGWVLLLTAPSGQAQAPAAISESRVGYRRAPLSKNARQALIASLFLPVLPAFFCVLYSPLPKDTTPAVLNISTMEFPDEWRVKEISLSPEEAEFFPRNEAAARKYRFRIPDATEGSVIFVSSSYWKAHHDPKNCLQSQGYNIINEDTLRLSENRLIHLLNIQNEKRTATALYWFQSKNKITDDFSIRLFASLTNRQQPWIMVSVILDKPVAAMPDVYSVMNTLSPLVSRQLNRPKTSL